jgi:hypothetical protein
VDAAVLDTMPYGLLGMPFFNHFRTSVDPVHGRLTLEEIDLDGIEGIYGGYDRGYWVGRFAMIRMTLERIDWYRAQIPEEFTEFVGRLEEVERYWLAQYEDLELRASQAGVPRAWRE